MVSPRHGPGTVTARGVRTVAESRSEYLTISMARRGITLMVPVSSVGSAGLRPLSSRSTAQQALQVLQEGPRVLPRQWHERQKAAAETLGSGDLVGLAGLVRDFSHAAHTKRPAASDREVCATARELLEIELTAILGTQAAPQLDHCLPEPAHGR